MGIETSLLISAAIAGVGTYLQSQSADDAADQQQKIINRAAEETSNLNKQKANLVTNFADKTYAPEARDKRYEDAATKNEGSLVDALLKANEGNNGGDVTNATQGALSSDYVRARGTATASAAEDIMKRAKLMARSNANSLLYNDEALQGGQLSSDVAGINSSIDRTNRSANTQLGGVRDKGSLIGGLLTGAAPLLGKLKMPA